MFELWFASHSRGKLNEYAALFNDLKIDLHFAAELKSFSAPAENGKTFADNALIKAKALASVKNKNWVFSEDSGLEAEGLQGLPGVHSARYAGNNASDQENRLKLLQMLRLRSPQNRACQFSASLCLISPQGEITSFTGLLRGKIAQKECGDSGFGYDSIFIPEGSDKTLAELGLAFKNQTSHRFLAAQKMIEHFRNLKLIP